MINHLNEYGILHLFFPKDLLVFDSLGDYLFLQVLLKLRHSSSFRWLSLLRNDNLGIGCSISTFFLPSEGLELSCPDSEWVLTSAPSSRASMSHLDLLFKAVAIACAVLGDCRRGLTEEGWRVGGAFEKAYFLPKRRCIRRVTHEFRHVIAHVSCSLRCIQTTTLCISPKTNEI